MLDDYDPTTQQLTYHCPNPDCKYHNCKNWEAFRECLHHDAVQYIVVQADNLRGQDAIMAQVSRDNRLEGSTHKHHISHPEIVWVDDSTVALPVCPDCAERGVHTQTFLKVRFTEQELRSENIRIPHRDPTNPAVITHFTQHPAVERHRQLAQDLPPPQVALPMLAGGTLDATLTVINPPT